MSEKLQPPLPADDDEGSAVWRPEPAETKRLKQKTNTGADILVPKRGEFYKNLSKASKPDDW